ncbi:MAG: type II secretion system F family protein [Planctomycetes bacterium]|nr:type II secretion system F family protein [Planctomycetota bacterium]
MPQFTYTAKDDYGRTINGALEADTEYSLAKTLHMSGYYLISAKPTRKSKIHKSPFVLRRVKKREIITFSLHLASALSAGIPILEALQDIEAQTNNVTFRAVVKDIYNSIRSGAKLSDALMRHPGTFSQLYCNIIMAGEASGNLDAVLHDLTAFLEWEEEMKGNVKQAIIYPAIVLSAATLLVAFLFTVVFPKFTKILIDLNVKLPLPTRIIITISELFRDYWPLMALGVVGIVTAYYLLVRWNAGRLFVDRTKLSLPIFGTLISKIALSRFAHFLGILFASGTDISHALTVVEGVVGNAVLARVVKNARDAVRAGQRLSEPLRVSGELPPLVVRMVEIGETSGEMDKALAKVSQYYDREVPATIKKVMAAFEPAMVVGLGGIVLLIALSMYLPLYSSLAHLGK